MFFTYVIVFEMNEFTQQIYIKAVHTVILEYFNVKEKVLSNFCLPVFLFRNPKQKEYVKCHDYFLRTTLTMHGNSSPFWKIAKMSLIIPGIFGPNYFFLRAMKVPLYDCIQNMCQALSKCLNKWIKVDKLDYFKK